jgi:hypothetical protein
MAGLGIQKRGNGIARVGLAKGGMAMDESMAHEGAESMAMEAKETKMEKKGYMENKKGKMIKKADMLTAKMSKKKKGKMMKGKR